MTRQPWVAPILRELDEVSAGACDRCDTICGPSHALPF